MCTKEFKSTKAITLIALVISILVLLILAGVSIGLLVGENGITGRAVTARKTYDIAGAKEKLELMATSYVGDFYESKYLTKNPNVISLGDYVASQFSVGTFEGNYILEKDINDSRKITISNNKYSDLSATCTISDEGQVVWQEPETGTLISTDENYQGYFADLNGDGKIEVDKDGVIYVDLLAQNGEEDEWGDENGAYTIPIAGSASSYKKYTISEETHTENNSFGTNNIIKLAKGTSGKDRFYVMALQDFTTDDFTGFYWYKNASGQMNDYNDEENGTLGDFGTGKSNTSRMIAKWNAYDAETDTGGYGAIDTQDMWGNIQTKVSDGWFVPSRAEWGAFGKTFEITTGNWEDYGLSWWYWTSSLKSDEKAWVCVLDDEDFLTQTVGYDIYVRLSTTF